MIIMKCGKCSEVIIAFIFFCRELLSSIIVECSKEYHNKILAKYTLDLAVFPFDFSFAIDPWNNIIPLIPSTNIIFPNTNSLTDF